MYCRRCFSRHLLQLEKKLPQDNEVFRCQECGFLFSPPEAGQGEAAETNPLGASSGATGGTTPPQLLVGPGE